MTIVAVVGDACTTTTVALAAAWPSSANAIVVEADPTGGDLAAWFDLPVEPSLSTLVTRTTDGSFAEVDRHTRLAGSGLRLIPAPSRAGEAQQAVAEAARTIVATLSTPRSPMTFVDTGRLAQPPVVHPFVHAASVVVLVHRQSTQSAAAAAVRLQRLAEQIEVCEARAAALVVTVIGAAPFDLDEIEHLSRRWRRIPSRDRAPCRRSGGVGVRRSDRCVGEAAGPAPAASRRCRPRTRCRARPA